MYIHISFYLNGNESICILMIFHFIQIECLARTNFKHRPLRRDIPQPRKHNVPKIHSLSVFDPSLYVC